MEESKPNGERIQNRPTFYPYTDIYENENALILVAEMPGVDEKSLDICLEKEILTIKGHIEESKLEEGYRCIHSEYSPTGDYERIFTVSDQIDSEKIEAAIKNGVLKMILPKAKKSKAKKINVKVE